MTLLVEQVDEAHGGTQLPRFRLHAARERESLPEIGLGQFCLPQFMPQFAASPENLRTIISFIGIRLERLLDRFERVSNCAGALLGGRPSTRYRC